MLELSWHAGSATVSTSTASPQIALTLGVHTRPDATPVHGLSLHVLVHIESAARAYSPAEAERLRELFGSAAQWPQSVRDLLWTRVSTQLGGFVGEREFTLELPCAADLELVAHKYFFGLQEGQVPLRLSFSGTILHGAPRLQVTPINCAQSLSLRVPLAVIRDAIARHHGDRMLLGVEREVFEALYRYRREHGLPNWEQVLTNLLARADVREDDA